MKNASHLIFKKFLDTFWFAPMDSLVRGYEAVIWQEYKFKPKVLDIGVGDGRYDALVFMGKKIDVGIDPDRHAFVKARKVKLFRKVLCESAESMSFKNGSFNTIVSNSAIEHIDDDIKTVKEVSRVLKKGGKFIFTVPTPEFNVYLKQCGVNVKNIKNFNKRAAHKHFRNFEEWKRILAKNSLRINYSRHYFPFDIFRTYILLYKIYTFIPFRRELWSYLQDSSLGKLYPKRLINSLLYKLLRRQFEESINKEGCLLFISAKKV